MQQHRFVREDREWYIDLPEFLAQGGSKGDLQMVSGADDMLDLIAADSAEVILQMDTLPFDSADELVLTEHCDPILGGGFYHLKNFEGAGIAKDMWLCEVTRFVFNDIPPQIFIKRVV